MACRFRPGDLVKVTQGLGITVIALSPNPHPHLRDARHKVAAEKPLMVVSVRENTWNSSLGRNDNALQLLAPDGGLGWNFEETNRFTRIRSADEA